MGTKTITVTEEAYERLKAHKRENESFTDVIQRLAGGEFMRGFGAREGEIDRDAYERRRSAFDASFDREGVVSEARRNEDDA